MKFLVLYTLLLINGICPVFADKYCYVNDSKNTIVLIQGKTTNEIKGLPNPDSVIISDVESSKDHILVGAIIKNTQGRKNIYSIDINNYEIRGMTSCYSHWKPFSLNKNKYILVAIDDNGTDRLIELRDGCEKKIIDIPCEWPLLSPSGRYLYFWSVNKYYIYSFDDKKYWQPVKNTTKRYPEKDWFISDLAWLNDNEIVFVDDEGLKVILIKEKKINLLLEEDGLEYLSYNPKTKTLLVVKSIYGEPEQTIIFRYDYKAHKKYDVLSNGALSGEIAWLDANNFLYSSNVEGNFNIYKYNCKKKTSIKLTAGSADYRHPFVIK